MRCPFSFLYLLLSLWGGTFLFADDVPVAPLTKISEPTWGEIYQLSSEGLTVWVSPATAGIVSLKFKGDDEMLEKPIQISAFSATAQTDPAPLWENRAWRTSEGRQVVMLTQNFGPPLSLRIVHLIELSASGEQLRQTTRITATGPGDPELLAPQLHIALTPPDRILKKEQLIFTQVQDLLCQWESRWEIEMPAQFLSNTLHYAPAEGHPNFTSTPEKSFSLPPQGWTMIHSILLDVSTLTTPDPQAIELWSHSEK
ncbi:hypothetical protein P3T73_12960 [Kiritimatiellota bacterium B12222]|nr:hypothetical protein P3T73_12960 [Kiritimatiellota bacterium B12222]